MIPSQRLIFALVIVAGLLLVGTLVPPVSALALLALALVTLAAGVDALLLPRRRNLGVAREVPDRISLGVPTTVHLEVRNDDRRSLHIILAEVLPDGAGSEPATVAGQFDGGSRGRLTYRLQVRHRGRFEWQQVDVRALPRWGLWWRQFRVTLPAALDVFPNLRDVGRQELLLRRGLAREAGLARQRQLGQGSEFESLRLFVPGDAMGRVDWKATARRRDLVVRNYQPERQQSIVLAIDVGRATAGEFAGMSRLDYLVNAALRLAHVALRQGDWFSLLAFSDRIESYLPPVRRPSNLERVAQALYTLEPRLVESDYGAACRFLGLKHRKRSLICLMTDVIDREASAEILAYMARFARRHLPLAVTLADTAIRAEAERPLAETEDPYVKAVALDVERARRTAITEMRHTGVDVLDVPPASLTVELINRYLLIKATRRL